MSRHRITNRAKAAKKARIAKGRHRAPQRRPEVATWLGAGALTLGMGAALASGSAIANADTPPNGSSTASGATTSGTPATSSGSQSSGPTPAPGSYSSNRSTRPTVGATQPGFPIKTGTTTAGTPAATLAKPPSSSPPATGSSAVNNPGSITWTSSATPGRPPFANTQAPPATTAGTGVTGKHLSPNLITNLSVTGPTDLSAVTVLAPAATPPQPAVIEKPLVHTGMLTTASALNTTTASGPTSAATGSSDTTPARAAAVKQISPVQTLVNVIANALVGIGGMNPTTPTPAPGNVVQLLLYSVARWLEDSVNPAGIPRAGTPNISAPDPTTGAVNFRPAFTDAAGAPLTYTASTDPTQGKVSVNADGQYTFTPTQASQLQAPEGGDTAKVAVTAYNGVQSTSQVLLVTITPVTPQLLDVVDGVFGGDIAINRLGSQLVKGNDTGYAGVSVINAYTDTVSATVNFGQTYPGGVAITPDGLAAYVTNVGEGCPTCQVAGTASQVALFNDTVTATIPVGFEPSAVAAGPANTPAAGKVYVANSCGSGQSSCSFPGPVPVGPGTVSVIDTATNKLIATVAVGGLPADLAVSPDGTRLYVANGANTVSVINTATNQRLYTSQTGAGAAKALAVSPDGTHIYVTNGWPGNTLDVIDTTTGLVTAEIPVGKSPDDVAVSPDGSVVYVSNYGDNNTPGTTVSVISTVTNKVIKTITVGRGPVAMTVSPDGGRLYVTTGDGLWVIGV